MSDSSAKEIAGLAVAAAELRELDASKTFGALVPRDYTFEHLVAHRDAPPRATGTCKPTTVDSFIEYVKRHRDPATTTIWVDGGRAAAGAIADAQVVAVLNDHAASESPEWGDHRATLKLETTPAWERWISRNGKLDDQLGFAQHIESSLLDIIEPDGATLLEVAQTIEGTQSAAFRSSRRLDNGATGFRFEETVDARAGEEGELEIPREFKVQLAPFAGESPLPIMAFLRYRIRNGKLEVGYELQRPDELLEQAVKNIANRLKDEFSEPGDDTSAAVFLGRPRS